MVWNRVRTTTWGERVVFATESSSSLATWEWFEEAIAIGGLRGNPPKVVVVVVMVVVVVEVMMVVVTLDGPVKAWHQ